MKFFKQKIKKITAGTKIIALQTLVYKAKTGMEKCQQRKNSPMDRANLGFVLMSFEKGLKDEKEKQELNQEVIKLLEGVIEWCGQTLKDWKEEKWESIDFETWQELINYLLNQAVALQNEQLASDA